ncbi:DUF1707 domain-containing protein [Nonomuraea angiospora]|uniref:DUF1707 domain-containing protein n=1 Tax=Nonomuraea angiospora TaxID=46172 RepID=UPI0029ACC0D6|nr:DUF1707 domain-containing protein [Nonomuraea angiospora]MDX3103161.1 DUF1707 domain-containing protein [Nonomuraea angiospora]
MQLRTRVSDGDRDMAVQRLQQAFADGRLGYGSATIVLPRGASANADGVRTEWGRVTCEAPGRPRPGAPHVLVTGTIPYGRLRIRVSRRWLSR